MICATPHVPCPSEHARPLLHLCVCVCVSVAHSRHINMTAVLGSFVMLLNKGSLSISVLTIENRCKAHHTGCQ